VRHRGLRGGAGDGRGHRRRSALGGVPRPGRRARPARVLVDADPVAAAPGRSRRARHLRRLLPRAARPRRPRPRGAGPRRVRGVHRDRGRPRGGRAARARGRVPRLRRPRQRRVLRVRGRDRDDRRREPPGVPEPRLQSRRADRRRAGAVRRRRAGPDAGRAAAPPGGRRVGDVRVDPHPQGRLDVPGRGADPDVHVARPPGRPGAGPRRRVAARPRGAAPAGAEDGGDRAAGRRRRSRLQQPAHRDQRLHRGPLGRSPAGAGARGPRGDPRRRQPRGGADRPAAGVQPAHDHRAAAAQPDRAGGPAGPDARAHPRRAHHAGDPARAGAAGGDGRRWADRAGAAQPRGQRARRDAPGRYADDHHRRRRQRAARAAGVPDRRGYRRGHDRRRARARVRAVLHHQAPGPGLGARPGDGLRHRQAGRRVHPGRQPGRATAAASRRACPRSTRSTRRPLASGPRTCAAPRWCSWSRTRPASAG
jgi:hypothetical protein